MSALNTTNSFATSTPPNTGGPATATSPLPNSIPHLRLAPYLTNAPSSSSGSSLSPSLRFPVIERFISPGVVVKVGRYTERTNRHQRNQPSPENEGLPSPGVQASPAGPSAAGTNCTAPPEDVLFKSKVVSRSHAEIWVEDGKFYIRDTSSSSGTFLNHSRLSAQNIRSDAHRLRDGDCLQLGVEYRGGEEEIYRCVRMRVELNRRSVASTALRMATFTALVEAQAISRQLRSQSSSAPLSPNLLNAPKDGRNGGDTKAPQEFTPQLSIGPVTTDCCICLLPLRRTPLFLTSCAHAFHYACVRTLLGTRRNRGGRTVFEPVDGFSCPMCRSYVDLAAEPADEDEDETAEVEEMTAIGLALGLNLPPDGTSTSRSSRVTPAPLTPVDPMLNNDPITPATPQMPRLIPARSDDTGPLTAHGLHFPHHTAMDDESDIPMDTGGLSSADDADADIEAAENDEHSTAHALPTSVGMPASIATTTALPVQMPGGGQSALLHGTSSPGANNEIGMDMDTNNTAGIDLTALLGKTVQTRQPSILLAEAAAAGAAAAAAENGTNDTRMIAGLGNPDLGDSSDGADASNIDMHHSHRTVVTGIINLEHHNAGSTTARTNGTSTTHHC